MASGFLWARGYRVTRVRIRAVLRSHDPLSTVMKWSGEITRRRVHSVAGTDLLWHIGMYGSCVMSAVYCIYFCSYVIRNFVITSDFVILNND